MALIRPLILVDIDGVINTDNKHSLAATFWSDVQKGAKIYYSPSVVNAINRWNTLAEVKQLTDWNERANTVLGPAIGLDFFELARNESSTNRISKIDAFISHACKSDPNRLIIWIDDELKSFKEQNDRSETTCSNRYVQYNVGIFTRSNTVLLSPAIGLSPEHVEFIDGILENPESVHGQCVMNFEAGERLYI